MSDIRNYDEQTKAYFDTLPKIVQESIVQSGADLQTKEDLMKAAAYMMQTGIASAEASPDSFPDIIPNLK